jgi:uncharacterized cupredoxin-like copper-binding protein
MLRIGIAIVGAVLSISTAWSAGDLTRQEPIEIKVDLGGQGSGQYAFHPNSIRLETGKLYKLVLHNPSQDPHYFSSPQLAALVFTRKVQVMDRPGASGKAIGEIKGAIREIEVYPGGTVEWFFVPVATGTADLHCPIMAPDGKTHAAHGMVGTVEVH